MPGIVFGTLALGGLAVAFVAASEDTSGAASLLVRARIPELAGDSAPGRSHGQHAHTHAYFHAYFRRGRVPAEWRRWPGSGSNPAANKDRHSHRDTDGHAHAYAHARRPDEPAPQRERRT